MKISKIKTIVAMTAMTILLGGCGDVPYELTESEEDIIVNYSAHVVAKFNKEQKQGLTYVNMDSIDEEKKEVQEIGSVPETEMPEDVEGATVSGNMEEGSQEMDATSDAVAITDIFGNESVNITYTGAYLTPNYIENDYYSVDAEKGKTYLVLGFELTNNGDEDVQVNNYEKVPTFSIHTADDISASAELTVLLEDFSTYQGTIVSGDTQKTVLLFQIPDTITEIPDFTLNVKIDGANYQIIL